MQHAFSRLRFGPRGGSTPRHALWPKRTTGHLLACLVVTVLPILAACASTPPVVQALPPVPDDKVFEGGATVGVGGAAYQGAGVGGFGTFKMHERLELSATGSLMAARNFIGSSSGLDWYSVTALDVSARWFALRDEAVVLGGTFALGGQLGLLGSTVIGAPYARVGVPISFLVTKEATPLTITLEPSVGAMFILPPSQFGGPSQVALFQRLPVSAWYRINDDIAFGAEVGFEVVEVQVYTIVVSPTLHGALAVSGTL